MPPQLFTTYVGTSPSCYWREEIRVGEAAIFASQAWIGLGCIQERVGWVPCQVLSAPLATSL